MTNPLARVAMANIARKSNLVDSSGNSDYLKKTTNKVREATFKSLDRVADEIRGYKKETQVNANTSIKSKPSTVNSINKNNLSLKELELLSATIKGEVKINTSTNISTRRNNTLSLESLAKNVKNNG